MDFYNHTRKLFPNSEVTLADLKVMLVNNHTFSATHTAIASVSGDEVSGNGWTAGGEAITNPTITVTDTNEATLDGDDISVTASGASIGPADALVIYADDGVDDPPLLHHAFASEQTAGDGTDFVITWNADGIHKWEAPA